MLIHRQVRKSRTISDSKLSIQVTTKYSGQVMENCSDHVLVLTINFYTDAALLVKCLHYIAFLEIDFLLKSSSYCDERTSEEVARSRPISPDRGLHKSLTETDF